MHQQQNADRESQEQFASIVKTVHSGRSLKGCLRLNTLPRALAVPCKA
jgi:hypothetical protein